MQPCLWLSWLLSTLLIMHAWVSGDGSPPCSSTPYYQDHCPFINLIRPLLSLSWKAKSIVSFGLLEGEGQKVWSIRNYCSSKCTHTHARTHTHTHTRTHTHTHTHTHAHTHACTYTCTHTCTHVCTHTTHARTQFLSRCTHHVRIIVN